MRQRVCVFIKKLPIYTASVIATRDKAIESVPLKWYSGNITYPVSIKIGSSLSYGVTSHSTQNRSFRRHSSPQSLGVVLKK